MPFEDTVNRGHDNKLTILYKKYINPREHISELRNSLQETNTSIDDL